MQKATEQFTFLDYFVKFDYTWRTETTSSSALVHLLEEQEEIISVSWLIFICK